MDAAGCRSIGSSSTFSRRIPYCPESFNSSTSLDAIALRRYLSEGAFGISG
jgi:hypothetical protein